MEIDQLPPATQKRVLGFKRDLGLYFRRIKKQADAKGPTNAQAKPTLEKDSNHAATLPIHKK